MGGGGGYPADSENAGSAKEQQIQLSREIPRRAPRITWVRRTNHRKANLEAGAQLTRHPLWAERLRPALLGTKPQGRGHPALLAGLQAAGGPAAAPQGPRSAAGTTRRIRCAGGRGQEGRRGALPASLRRSGYASPSSFWASERPAAAGRSRESSLGAAAAAGTVGPRRQASPPARAPPAGPPESRARGRRGVPGGRGRSCRSRARPAPPPGPPPGQLLAQQRRLRAAPASPRGPGPAHQSRGGPRPVGSGRDTGARAAGVHAKVSGPRLTSRRSGQASGPRMAPRPS